MTNQERIRINNIIKVTSYNLMKGIKPNGTRLKPISREYELGQIKCSKCKQYEYPEFMLVVGERTKNYKRVKIYECQECYKIL